MRTLYLLCVGLHVFAAIVWIGGMAFMVFAIVPTWRKSVAAPEVRTRLLHELAIRFRTIAWIALATLVATGAGNLWFRGVRAEDFFSGRTFAGTGPWGVHLAEKLAVVAVILLVSAAHDFWIGPRALRQAQEAPEAPARERFRRAASWAGRLNFVLAVIVLALALQLVR
jgi:uncharacterized membrane protein